MARKLGSKDKVKRKSRNILGTVAKVGAGLVGAGLVGGTIYTGARIGAISKRLQRSNVDDYEAFKNSPKFVKIAYGKLSDLNENLAKTIANDSNSPMQGLGKSILDNARRSKLKMRKGFLESTKLDQKINAQKAAIAHTKTGDLAGQSDEFKKSIVDRQRDARKKTRAEGDLTRRMQDEIGQYFQTTSSGTSNKAKVHPMILRPGYTTTPRIGKAPRKKFLGLFNNLSLSNMFILSDVNQSNYARRLGSKDKKKRKDKDIYQIINEAQNKQIRSMTPEQRENQARKSALIMGGIGTGYGAAIHGAAHADSNLGKMMYGSMQGTKKLTVPIAIAGTAIGAGLGGGLSYYLAKRRQKQALNSK
jgi:hypothetical protein